MNIFSITDLVYNQAESDWALFYYHSESIYDEIIFSHFKSASLLDPVLLQFTHDANENKLSEVIH